MQIKYFVIAMTFQQNSFVKLFLLFEQKVLKKCECLNSTDEYGYVSKKYH